MGLRRYLVPALLLGALVPGIVLGGARLIREDLEQEKDDFGLVIRTSEPTPEVPLVLWTSDDYPGGLPIGEVHGISWGDYDADGYVDLFACHSGHLWRNVEGRTWEFAADLGMTLPVTERRYGASFGDYDRDGLLDIATEPRFPYWGDDKLHLLRNLGEGAEFVDVATDPAIVDVQPYNNGETLCWGDVDGDRNLDIFLPVYPEFMAGPGNFFLHNLGPTGPGGAYRFTEVSAAAGLDNPPGSARPEGAQFADVDFDGDIDLFSNGTLYRNVSTLGTPAFEVMPEESCGIGLRESRDEGAMFFDHDLDGDQDLVVVYSDEGVWIWENRGDGTFFAAEQAIVDSPMAGLNLGLSAEDWDNDGDVDFTTRQVFRRNMLVEEGQPHFTVASHDLPTEHVNAATPAWGDWDRDGDLDCALGNHGQEAHLYENLLYTPDTPRSLRRHVRVRVVGDSPDVERGLEVEYGATAEVRLTNVEDGWTRRKFLASSHGYLNQNEYALQFALPADPEPADLGRDVRFDLSVDFPGLPVDGLWRVDEHANPALGGIDLADLTDREIQVYRCGRVVVDGEAHDPLPLASPRLITTTNGLASPSVTEPLPAPLDAPEPDWFTGLAFDTMNATSLLRISEIILDGQLDTPAACFEHPFNIALWDVTDSANPILVDGGALIAGTAPRNRRSYLRTDLILQPYKSYRLVARVTGLRGTAIAAPVEEGPITIRGGLDYRDPVPCSGETAAGVQVDPASTSLALRFGTVPPSEAADPVGATLRLEKVAGREPVLTWHDPPASNFEVLRCDARHGPCVPTMHAMSTENFFRDSQFAPAPGEMFWYRVNAVNECTAALYDHSGD